MTSSGIVRANEIQADFFTVFDFFVDKINQWLKDDFSFFGNV